MRNASLRIAGGGKMVGEHVREIDELKNLPRGVGGGVDPSEEAGNGLLDRLADAEGRGTLTYPLRIVAGPATSRMSENLTPIESDSQVLG